MKLQQSFEVEAPVESVWQTLIDVERVAPCLPGAEITEARDDGSYEGSFKVKLGPTTAAYTGRLSMEELDEPARRGTMKASGRDKRGQGSANATIVSTLHAAGDTTRVDVETDFTITGRLARFGRGGMIEDISNRLLRDFAECLQRNLEGEGVAASGETGETGETATGEAASGPPSAGEQPAPAAEPAPVERPAPGGPEASGAGTPSSEAKPTPAPPRTRPTAQPAKPVSGISLFFSALADRIRRFLAKRRS